MKLTEVMGILAEKKQGINRSTTLKRLQKENGENLVTMKVSDNIMQELINNKCHVLLFCIEKNEFKKIIKEKSTINE